MTGAGGYIGNHCALKLLPSGHSSFGLDAIRPKYTSLFQKFYTGDHGDTALLQRILKEERIECIIHASGASNVMDTVRDPIKYYGNDLMGTTFLLQTAIENNVKKIIFLSSAQVYGNSSPPPATENTPPNPINPLGKIKLAIEQLIESLSVSHDLHYAILRISNAIGMDHQAENFPSNGDLLSQILHNGSLDLFGTDFNTADHRAERDFIHVSDVAQAVLQVLPKLGGFQKNFCYNIASGKSYSVADFIKSVEKVTHLTVAINPRERRTGEIERLAIDPYLAQRELGWRPQYSLEYMIESSVNWLKNNGE
ncbi:MAG: GDP-mannose 4,6-dehydratase [Puniceicoccales bacterium]|jgi:UDP-glucose 4-epimerase|nr:GDP-mannose 4,6-dehydratase [Puniceicoccales bacterium]